MTRQLHLLVLTLCLWPLAIPAAELRIGRAAVSITPPVGTPTGSSYGLAPAVAIHDDLFAKAIVLEVDGAKAAIVACDLVSIRKAIVAEARRLIATTTGLRPERVILSATHCHAGPQMHPLFLSMVPDAGRQLAEKYVAELPGKIAEAVRRAEADLRPARAWVASESEESISFNRRFLLRDGTVQMNPGRRNPNAVRPVGPIDPEVSVVYFDAPDGTPLATHVNFALHVAIVSGREVSSDYPGVLSKVLADAKGPGMLTVFTNGMSGNINHIDVNDARQLSGHNEAARVGTILAAKVLRAYKHLRPVTPAHLTAATRGVDLPVPEVTPTEVDRAKQTMAQYGKPGAPPFLDVVHAWKVLDVAELGGKPLDTEVQAITMGDDLAWVGMPGDAFVELGLAVKQNSPFRRTIVSEQSGSGAISYVPNRKAFPEGGYEVISARFAAGGGEMLSDAAIKLLMELYRSGTAPKPSDGPRRTQP
jgi:neutral ceramidase